LGYYGPEWDKKIQDKDNPNFWKYGVANLVFLNLIGNKKMILDIGCGTGGLTLFLAEHAQIDRIVGIDPVKNMIQIAKLNASERGLSNKTDFVVCDGRHLPFIKSYFDAAVSRGDAFVFLVPQKTTLIEFSRVLNDDATVIVEIDNVRWKPGETISCGFEKMADGVVAYSVEDFDVNRNHTKTFYVLDSNGAIAKEIYKDKEFIQTGRLKRQVAIERIKKQTIEIRHSAVTHWPTVDEIKALFMEEGFRNVEILGNGLLMGLLLEGDQKVVKAMKKQPDLFFEIERKLIRFIDPREAYTVILKADVNEISNSRLNSENASKT